MDSERADHPYPPPSRSIYHLAMASPTATRSPAHSPSHHIFSSLESASTPTSFLSPSPSKLPNLPTASTSAFTFPLHSSLLPPCPLSPSHSLFSSPQLPSSSSSATTSSYSRPSSPVPADPYIASILSSPSDFGFPAHFSDELSEPISDMCDITEVGEIGNVVLSSSSPSSPSCTSPWSNVFEVSGGECDSGSGSGGSDSESRGEGASSDGSSLIASVERECQPTTDDDDTCTAVTPTSPPPATTQRRRKLTAKQQQQTASKPAEKGRKRRLTATASPTPQQDEAVELPEDKRERNKQSASDYRKRRKLYVVSLEQQLSELKATLRLEREEGKKLRGENTVLRASMQMMREFVQGKVTKASKAEEKEADRSDDEEESTEAVKRWDAAVSVRVPEEYRPVAPSQRKVEADVEEGATHQHNTRKRRGRAGAAAGGKGQHKVGLTLFVLFSCFLLYFPWLTDLSHPLLHAPSPSSTAASDAAMGGEPSRFYVSAPDCGVQPELCHRGRTILAMMEEDVGLQLTEQHYAAASAVASRMLMDDGAQLSQLEALITPMVAVKAEPYGVKDELSVHEVAAAVMSPLSLPISAHNASAALAWLGEDEDGIEQLLLTEPAMPLSCGTSQHDDGAWAAAGHSGMAQQAV